MKLEQYNISELSREELQEIEGGFIAMFAAAYVGIAMNEMMNNPRGVLDGMIDALT